MSTIIFRQLFAAPLFSSSSLVAFRRVAPLQLLLRMTSTDAAEKTVRMIDIGANLTDEMYGGVYNGSVKHEADLSAVLDRASAVGVDGVFVTAGSLSEAKKAVQLCRESATRRTSCWLLSTVGVHPTRCGEFESEGTTTPTAYLTSLKELIASNRDVVVALGEFGLDSDRIQFCDYETQQRNFELQLRELGPSTGLPLFLHCRGVTAASDLIRILSANPTCFPAGGVVHSFDGSIDDLNQFLKLGLHIGVNGCSLKTEATCSVVREIPLDRLLLETDAPWCSIRPSHFPSKLIKTNFPSSKKNYNPQQLFKNRNEPCTLLNVLEVVAGLRGGGMDVADLAATVYANTTRLFNLDNFSKNKQ